MQKLILEQRDSVKNNSMAGCIVNRRIKGKVLLLSGYWQGGFVYK
jgi:hypothetical protein